MGNRARRTSERQGGRRSILLHLGAVAITLSPLVFLELVLRLFVSAPAIYLDDPYVSFGGLRPLFVLDSSGKRFETAEERRSFFNRQSFAAVKDPKGLRTFCLGGSTVQGRPYSVDTSFSTWLKLNMDTAQPGTDSEVINCGGVSYASYRLVPIMRELLAYEPDLFIIYTGHNEFLEDRTYKRLKKLPPTFIRLHWQLLRSRSYALGHRLVSGYRSQSVPAGDSSATLLPTEVQAKLDNENGLESYRRDEQWHSGVIQHFRHNLDTMVRMSRHAGVPVILVNPVSNLKDCPPFKSVYRSDLSEAQKRHVLDLRKQALKLDWSDAYGKIRLLKKAAAIDNRHAATLYLLGKCYERLGRWREAKQWFLLAKEHDICPLRILEPMREAVSEIAAQYRVRVVDAEKLISERTEDGIPGDEWLLDHVHPSIAGHQLIADTLYQTMADMDLLITPENWRASKQQQWYRHLLSLDRVYFENGVQRLKSLRAWSRGPLPGKDARGQDKM